jgi:preprotein translocase subunit SecY
MILYALGIVFFSFFYTAVVFNPKKPPKTSSATAASFPASVRARTPRSIWTTC